jgi:hypothetical protein
MEKRGKKTEGKTTIATDKGESHLALALKSTVSFFTIARIFLFLDKKEGEG